jgi:uncharacterized protein (DUF1501 family)
LIGCSLAASPLVTPVSFASLPGDGRLVVIVLRGAMDGLAAVAPYGDPDYARWRGAPDLGGQGAVDLDGFYAMHSALRPLLPLWQAGDLGFIHAVSTPYRDKRSHFDGQDLLEAGMADLSGGRGQSGWLNRMLLDLPHGRAETAYAIGNDALALLNGEAPVRRWSPGVDLTMSPQALRLAQLVMAEDPDIARALDIAFDLAGSDGDPVVFEGASDDMMQMMLQDGNAARRGGGPQGLARFAAQRLMQEARVASFSITGWDTHAKQERLLTKRLKTLSQVILELQQGLSPTVWAQTAIVAVTEFGRTVQINGTKGTDHGTGGAMVLAGGAIRGGRVMADWPGLAEADLYQRRDLMPTADLRAYLGWIIRGLFNLNADQITGRVFPGLDLGVDPKLLL